MNRRISLSLFVLAMFALADELGQLLPWIPAYDALREGSLYAASAVRTLLGLALVTVAASLFRRAGEPGSWRALGVSAPLARPALAMLVAGLPMLVTYGLAAGLPSGLDGTELLFGAVVWPLREEWIYRGYAFGQLTQRSGWGFWPAAFATSLLFSVGTSTRWSPARSTGAARSASWRSPAPAASSTAGSSAAGARTSGHHSFSTCS